MYDKLNEQQKEAVFHTEGPLLILAGAGSGKTSVITHRIAYLIDEANVNPYNILAITFTNKAAGEMRERVDNLVGFGSEQIFVSTFHSLCVRILRRHAENLGYTNNFSIYDSDDQKTVMKEVIKKLNLDTKHYKEKALLSKISSLKDELVSPEEFAISAAGDYEKRITASCYSEYQSALKKSNALDFDDLIVEAVELFKTCPEVLNSYVNRFKYIMVDEYQDTNTAQFELVRLLTGSNRNLCVVGDDDQSIYKFRGANIRNILDFERFFPEAKVIKLEQNYRSVQNILDAANAVIRNNSERKDKALWSKQKEGDRIHFREFDNSYEEAEFVARDIKKSVQEGKSDFGDNAILYRTNAQSRSMEEKLVQENVPYKIFGGVNFYSRREIKDLLAYLKTIDNARDDLCVKRIINIPKRGIGATTINKLQATADERNTTFFDSLMHPEWSDLKGAAADKLHGFELLILRLRAMAESEKPTAVLKEILDTTDYINQMDVEDEEDAENRIENIEELISKARLYEEEAEEPTLSGLLEEIALVADIDSYDESESRVVLMTIHSAKGLEFKNVYMVGMEDGLFPSYNSINQGDAEIEEERRLCYVGITRAKEKLTLTRAKARMMHGDTQYNPLSRFVNEIPRQLFDIAPVTRKYNDSYYDPDTSESGGYRRYDNYRDDESGYGSFKRNSSYDGASGYGSNSSGKTGYSGFSREASAGSSYSSGIFSGYKRPTAYNTKKETPEEEKPFFTKMNGLSGLTKGSDLAKPTGDLSAGDRVKHIKFGEGTVISVVKETKDSKVTVQFDTAGQRIMYASFAKLQKI
jgi:DNA helicase-2/ATP-dependent DNA helicase PcrA